LLPVGISIFFLRKRRRFVSIQPIKEIETMSKLKEEMNQDPLIPVVFTVSQEQKTFWVLVACPSDKVNELERSYAQMLNVAVEIDLESILKSVGAEVRDYGEVEDVIENGQVIGKKIPDYILEISSCVIGQKEEDPELDVHPQEYLPGNDNSS